MARVPRNLSVLSNFAVHKVWRGHNREPNLGTDEDKIRYLGFLNADLESKKYQSGAELNALCLMTNHSHEIDKVINQTFFSNHMRRHHSRYGADFNKRQSRCGKVAQDRPFTTLLADDCREMEATFYVHANPVRANLVKDARNYCWSTHRLYAFGKREPWMRNIVLPGWYLKLGRTDALRQREYRKLFARYLKEKGRTKQEFLKRRFFGPLLWVREMDKRVREWRREHAPPP